MNLSSVYRVFVVVLLLLSSSAFAEVLMDESFSDPSALRHFRVMRAGNYGKGPLFAKQSVTFPMQAVEIDGVTKWPAMLYNGCDTGWNYIAVDFNANELPVSGTLRFTAWLKTNSPRQVKLIATEGARVGNGLIKKAIKHPGETLTRQVVSVELGRFNAGDGFSFGCGIDYHGGGTWVIIDRIRIEHIPTIAAVGIERNVSTKETGEDYDIPEITGPYSFLNEVIANQSPKNPTVTPVPTLSSSDGILYSNNFSSPLDYTQLRQVSASRYPNGMYYPDWGNNLYINTDQVKIDDKELSPLLLYCGGSANYTVADFAPSAFPMQGKIRVRVSLKTNNPEQIELIYSEKTPFSGLPEQKSPVRDTQKRQYAVAYFDRSDSSMPFSVGVGIKSGARGTWLQVDSIIVDGAERFTRQVRSTFIEDVQAPTLGLDYQFLKSRLDMSVLTPWPLEYERLKAAGLVDVPAVKQKIQRMNALADIAENGLDLGGDGEVNLVNLTKVCDAIKDDQFGIKIRGGDYPFGMQSTIVPGSDDALTVSSLAGAVPLKTLLLNNNSGEQFNLTVTAQGDIASMLNIYRLHWVYGAPDYPELLDRFQVVEIPSGKLAGVLLKFDTTGVKPGTYSGEVWVSPLNDHRPIQKIQCTLKVIEAEHDDRDYPHVMGYEANHNTKPGLLKLMVEQKVDTFHIFCTKQDTLPLQNFMKQVDMLGVREKIKRLRIEAHFVPMRSGNAKRNNPGWVPECNTWLDNIVGELESHGFGYDDWVLYTYDECQVPEFLRDLKRIRAHNKNVRTFSDFATEDISVYEKYEPYMNVWQPGTDVFLDQAARPNASKWYIENGNNPGRELWTYYCDATPQDSILKYQIHGWVNWRISAVGMAFYSVKPCNLRPAKGRYNFGMCYETSPGVYTPSRRWMVWRESIEDYRLLKVAARLDPKRTQELADQVIDAHSRTTEPAALSHAVTQARAALLEMIAKTKK